MLRLMKNKMSSISRMKYMFLLFCAVFLLVMGIGNTISYVMTKTPTLVNMFLNGMNPDGNLVIQKTVSHPYGDSYIVPSDLVFTFEVNLGAEYANQTVKTTQGEIVANDQGIVTVAVAPGGRTTIYDVDEETTVTVTETLIGTGFTPDAESKNLTIQKYQDNSLNFINTYTPALADTSALVVSGSKTLVGRDWMEGDSFTFALEVKENREWKSLGTQTVTYELVEQSDPTNPEKTIAVPKTDFDKFDFTELIRRYNFANAGSYSFRISEIEGSIGGVTYDKAESKFDVLVGDVEMDGYLEIQSITTSSANTIVEGTTVSIGFENSYAPIGSTEAFIDIQKIMEDTSGQNKTTAGYVFELYDEENKLIAASNPTDSTGETSICLVYEPTDAGKNFDYVLKEKGCGQTIGALTYDDASYPVRVSVVDNLDGTVSAWIYDRSNVPGDSGVVSGGDAGTSSDGTGTVSGGNAGMVPGGFGTVSGSDAGKSMTSIPPGASNVCRKIFTNQYDPRDASVVLAGSKTLDGRAMNAEEFSFRLYQTDALFGISEGAQPVCTAVNAADGTFSFDSLSFDKVGNYYYVAKEDSSAALKGITYDNTTYLITVSVTDKDGVLESAVKITDAYGKESDLVFRNSYKAAPVYLPLSGKKTLSGATLENGAFQFRLFLADETFATRGDALQTATNSANGEFGFETLAFSKADTYRYIVIEQSGTLEGMQYDDTKYCITVQVADPGNGQLIISGFDMTADGNNVSEIVFENVYAEPEKPEEPDSPDEPEKPEEPDSPDKPENPDEPDKPEIPDQPVTPEQPSNPDELQDTENPERPTTPKTGDDSNAVFWFVMLVLSGVMIILLFMVKKLKKRKDTGGEVHERV